LAFVDPGEARRAAEELLAQDPGLDRPEHALLAARVADLLAKQRAGVATERETETASLAYV
jgi:hypothetical protein